MEGHAPPGIRSLAESALSSAADAALTVDTGGVITAWNEAAESLFGHSATEAVGQTLALVIPAAFRPRHMAAFHAALDSGSLVHLGKPARIQAMTPKETRRHSP
jgi:PAS domain S-box-containing protein